MRQLFKKKIKNNIYLSILSVFKPFCDQTIAIMGECDALVSGHTAGYNEHRHWFELGYNAKNTTSYSPAVDSIAHPSSVRPTPLGVT